MFLSICAAVNLRGTPAIVRITETAFEVALMLLDVEKDI